MKIFVRACVFIAAIVFPLVCILGAGVLVSRAPDFYGYEFAKLQSIRNAGVGVTDKDMAAHFSAFINGSIESFQIKAEYQGETVDLFSAKELVHMADVKTLVDQLTIAGAVCAVLLAASAVVLIRLVDKELLRKAYKAGLVIYAAILVFLTAAMLTNFTAGFYAFHRIFFTNELWLLDPEQDVLLMIMPEKFFVDGAVAVLGISTAMLVVMGLITWKLTKERKMFSAD